MPKIATREEIGKVAHAFIWALVVAVLLCLFLDFLKIRKSWLLIPQTIEEGVAK